MIQRPLLTFHESVVEEAALGYFRDLGYETKFGPDIAPDGKEKERENWNDAVLIGRLRAAIDRLNPHLTPEAREDALRKVLRSDTPSLIQSNRRFHDLFANGVDVESRGKDGRIKGDKAWLVGFDHPENNDWLVVNQFAVIKNGHSRRPDLGVFLNGLPVALFELKNPADEEATIWTAYQQLQTYQAEIPAIFRSNELLVISDGTEARLGCLTSNRERFMPWRTVDGKEIAPKGSLELETLVRGVFEKGRLLDLLRNFIVFEDDGGAISKKVAAYHQFHAVNRAVEATVKAASEKGDKRVGVVWHTQGSGKSLTMTFYAAKIARHPALANPTLVVLTDRNDLDGQLFGKFSICQSLLRQTPVQAESVEHLQELLKVASGGIVFTTIQKFRPEKKGERFPLLSKRRNILFIADEAHRSQYDFIDGFARKVREALPNASFLGFTGTPIEKADRNTRAVFGDYIDTYDIHRAVEDGATVTIYYEGRLAKLELKKAEVPHIDPDFEEVTEGEEEATKEGLKRKWAQLEAMVGTPERLALLAKDLVAHFEKRLETLEGKGMVVCMSRRICVGLFNEIARLRPSWVDTDDLRGSLKVVMTGSASDGPEWQPHIRNKPKREGLAKRFRDPKDLFKLVIVRDMWLTGFDAPSLHTMYIDKPMRGHGMMQTIARVNRTFKDKPGGLIVDYLGIADELRRALADYSSEDSKRAGVPVEEAVRLMQKHYEIVRDMFHGFNSQPYFAGTPDERLKTIPRAMQHILGLDDGEKRYLKAVTDLSKSHALSVPDPRAAAIADEIGFFQAVRSALAKATVDGRKTPEELDSAVRQIVSKAVVSDEVVDIFSAAGLKKPELSIFSDEFLDEVRRLPYRNLALEVLRKLLNDETRAWTKRNLVLGRQFSEMLEATIRKYQNRSIDAAQVISSLIDLAKSMKDARDRGAMLGLTQEEEAFYDALVAADETALGVLGDVSLREIAKQLVETVRKNVSIDWTVKETVRAKLRLYVKRILKERGYPPSGQEAATQTVLQQAELLCAGWG
ncbi:MAG: type I restriction endonuclease subunit R [Nitrososphaerota archaeon]|jgi:type I restriction enzyme R subunit|nr:type I restriction endonuclease subunit R [Nitrososphaerota archaeon]